jgi:opacity protein-like surface antigen
MLKKLTLAGIAIIASSNIAFADDLTSYSSSDTATSVAKTTAVGDEPESQAIDVVSSSAKASSAAVHHKAKSKTKHHHKKPHHHHHHAVMKSAPVVAEDYKNEGAVAEPSSQVAATEMPSTEMTSCPACEHSALSQGPYLGFGIGSRVNSIDNNAFYTGAEGTLFAGYSTIWQQMYAAFEVFAQNSATAIDYRVPAGSARSNWNYGLSVLPGYLLTDQTLGYLRLGGVHSRFNNRSSHINGAQFGFGMQTALSNAWEIRGEWDFTCYKAMKMGQDSAHLVKKSPHSQQFSLSMLYKLAM